ncbi:hypothetical protein B0T21DRAFT_414996 [Apiosordaria backusii]|uniref:F-box domain-containing protein n=1 Tax=Apiosordaria backusii TaxID=314023 RepID=A0AA40AN99_9PEZI|nr:hypothetical protein B0T21DRAFT_414996 [Apiosordaria backusii]
MAPVTRRSRMKVYAFRPRKQQAVKPQTNKQPRIYQATGRKRPRTWRRRIRDAVTETVAPKPAQPLGAFSRLPNEVIFNIISADLDIPTLANIRRVCKFFRKVVDCEVKQYVKLVERVPQLVQRIILQNPAPLSCKSIHAKFQTLVCKRCNKDTESIYQYAFNLITGEMVCSTCSGSIGIRRTYHLQRISHALPQIPAVILPWIEGHLKKHLKKAGVAFTNDTLAKIPHIRVLNPWNMDCKPRNNGKRPSGRTVICYDAKAVQEQFGLEKKIRCGCDKTGYPVSEEAIYENRATLIPATMFLRGTPGRDPLEDLAI